MASWAGRRYVVVNHPEGDSGRPGAAWFDEGNGRLAYFTPDNYKIISRLNNETRCQDCKAGGDVDTFLDEQRDDNLRSMFE